MRSERSFSMIGDPCHETFSDFSNRAGAGLLVSPAAGQGMPETIRKQIDQHLIGRWPSQLDFDGKTTTERFT